LRAYEERCAICRFPHLRLLEAAHILPDRDVRGEPEVRNGLALCRLHHGAFDANLLGIRPNGQIEIAQTLLEARDGPTLEHGIKSFHGKLLHLPRREDERPRKDYLEERYEQFRAVVAR
jgi:putative restriction endonuclease